jgi:hypothetical protein
VIQILRGGASVSGQNIQSKQQPLEIDAAPFAPLAHKFKTVLCWCRQIEGQDGLVMGYGFCALNNHCGSDNMQPSKFAQSEFSVRTHVGILAQYL